METQTSELTITYFPYTFLGEIELKRLILYFDVIRLLQVLPDFDPGLPDPLRTSSLVQSFCPLSVPSIIETIKRAHRSYHQLGNVHRGGGLVELLRTFALQEDVEDSRTGLVAHLRQAQPRLAPEEVELVNDAVFLILAHELDRAHLELDLHLDRIRGMETALHKEVGIGTDEETDSLGMEPPVLLESDHPRTQYPRQRLRAWIRFYCLQEKPDDFLPLTTSTEVLAEISERLPSPLTGPTDGPLTMLPEQYPLSTLPDPQPLSLEEILEFRQSLSCESVLDNWRLSVAAAINRLQQETLGKEHWRELQQQVQRAADEFQQHWSAPEKPARYLRLEAIRYPNLQADHAFSLATGLATQDGALPTANGENCITLLLAPSALPPDDRQ